MNESKINIAGTYNVVTKSPMGSQEGKLTLRVDGHELSGSLETAGGKSDLADGTVDGKEVSFVTKVKTPPGRLKAHVTATIDGDTLVGTSKLPLGTASLEGTRA